MSSFKKIYPFLILAALAFIIHFAFLSYPAQVVFDEVHFGKFVSAYFTGQYYFDIHPPLGKLLIAGFAKLAGAGPSTGSGQVFDFNHIGEAANPAMLFALRFLPALSGALFVLLFAWLAWLLFRSQKTALIAGFLILLCNAVLTQTKFILVDGFLLLFEFLTFCFFFLWQRQKTYGAKWWLYLFLTSFSFGLTISIKWTGLATLGIIGVILLTKIFSEKLREFLSFGRPEQNEKMLLHSIPEKTKRTKTIQLKTDPSAPPIGKKLKIIEREKIKEFAVGVIFLFVIGFAVYAIPFYIHFNLLQKSGPGSVFMSWQFQQELKYGREAVYQPLGFWQKFFELNKTMYTANASITAGHPFGSRWYSWPFDIKPVYYWEGSRLPAGRAANIYFMGNPALWWLAGATVICALLQIFSKKSRQKLSPAIYMLLLAFLANWLPFIAVKRVSFLYHYLLSASLGIMLLSFYLSKINEINKKTFAAIILFIILGFVFVSPLSYGLDIPAGLYHQELKLIQLLN